MDTIQLKILRMALGYTQDEFAARLEHPDTGRKVTSGTIASWEQAKALRQLPAWVDVAAKTLEVKVKRAMNAMPKTERKLGKLARIEKAEAEARATGAVSAPGIDPEVAYVAKHGPRQK